MCVSTPRMYPRSSYILVILLFLIIAIINLTPERSEAHLVDALDDYIDNQYIKMMPDQKFDIADNDEIVGICGRNFTFFVGSGRIYQLNSDLLDLEDLQTALVDQDFPKLQKYQQLCQAIEEVGDVGKITDVNQNVMINYPCIHLYSTSSLS